MANSALQSGSFWLTNSRQYGPRFLISSVLSSAPPPNAFGSNGTSSSMWLLMPLNALCCLRFNGFLRLRGALIRAPRKATSTLVSLVAFQLVALRRARSCALSQTVEVGLDLERVTRDAPVELAQRYFAVEEEQWLNDLPPSARQTGFFQLWTMKEAFIKATGDGLSQSLRDFAIGFSPLRVSFRNPGLGDERAWRFVQRAIGDEHLLSLAWRGGNAQMSVGTEQVQLEKLLAIAKRSASILPRIPLPEVEWIVARGRNE